MNEEAKKVREAWEVIVNSSNQAKRMAFREEISQLRAIHIDIIKNQRADLYDVTWAAGYIGNSILNYVEQLCGYKPHQIFETITPYLTETKTGRPQKYSPQEKLIIGTLIEALENNGSTPTQAMKLVMRINGDRAMSEGHLRLIRSIYKNYNELFNNKNLESRMSLLTRIYLQDYEECDLVSNELASEKAKNAFLITWPKVLKACIKRNPMLEAESIINQNLIKKIHASSDEELIRMLIDDRNALKKLLQNRHYYF